MRLFVFALLAFCAAPAFAQDMPDCPDPARIVEGEQAFTGFCRACHSTDQIVKWMGRQADGEAALTTFLGRHGSCPPNVDAAIAAYVASLMP
jgi:mono/diheme cytochrome c family protein